MDKLSSPISGIKGFSLLAASLLMFAGAPSAQATDYVVSGKFVDGGIQGETLFNGSFSWDGTTLSNFTGGLTQSMWAWKDSANAYQTRMNYCGMGNSMGCVPADYNPATTEGNPPVLNLTYQLGGYSVDGNGNVMASVFLQNSTDVFSGGGYNKGDVYKYGNSAVMSVPADGNTPNQNAYFTLFFNALTPQYTALTASQMVYGDCTAMGLMMPMMTGNLCMTGHNLGTGGSMGGMPTMLNISEVPVPAAAWLFGGALMSLFGANRRKSFMAA